MNTKHLYNICTMLDQRRSGWADVVQILNKCIVFNNNNTPIVLACTVHQKVNIPAMLGHSLRRFPNIGRSLIRCAVLAGYV